IPWQPIVGSVLSMTVFVSETVALELSQSSDALHVLVSANVPAQDPWVVTSLTCCTVADEQASEAVGAVKLGTEGQEIVALIPWPPIVGGVLSMTVTV